MGQMANGILYGCVAPKLRATKKCESPLYDLVERWEEARETRKPAWRIQGPKIRIEREGDKELLGVWVACGGGGEDGSPYFLEKCVPVDEVELHYAKQITKVEKLWDRFAKWVLENEKIELPPPRLWLTPCETA